MKIVYFAPIAFNGLKQRPQELAIELSEYADVWYIEPTISSIGCLKNKTLTCKSYEYDICETLHIKRLNGIFALPIRFQIYDFFQLNTIYESIQLYPIIYKADALIIGYETWYRLFPHLKKVFTIYDKMDDNAQLHQSKTIKKYLRSCDKKMCQNSDYIFVTAQKFYNNLHLKYNNIQLLPNAIGRDFQNLPISQNSLSSTKVFGYVGMISSWFDLHAIQIIAKTFPQCKIILVGPNELPELKLKNVYYIGRVAKAEIPGWIHQFDICLYPFKTGNITDTINPVKIYEYLALNKPVVAVSSVETRQFGDKLYLYRNYEELKELIQKELEIPFKTDEEHQRFLSNNSWENRAKKIYELILKSKIQKGRGKK